MEVIDMKWISVKDGLPTEKQSYEYTSLLLVVEFQCGFRNIFEGKFYPKTEGSKFNFFFELETPRHNPFKVTHWMVAPELPKE